MNLILIPIAWGLLNLCLAFMSYSNIRNSKDNIKFIYNWGFIFGAFVWEDLQVFSLFNIALSVFTVLIGNLLPGMVLMVIFWIVRNAGETLYFMLQQFIEPKHTPHEIDLHFKLLRKFFGKISTQKCFIIMQVFHQTFLVIFIYILIVLLKYSPDLRF